MVNRPELAVFQAQDQAAARTGIVRSAGAGTGYDADAFASPVADECAGWEPWMSFDPYGYGYWLDQPRNQGSTMIGPREGASRTNRGRGATAPRRGAGARRGRQ